MKILSEIISELESGSRPKGGVTSEGDIPSLGAEHLDGDGGFTFKNVKRISREFYNCLTSGKLSNADILIVKDGATTGKVSFLTEEFPFKEASINEHVFRIKIDENLAFPKYVFHFLKSDIGNRQIMRDFHGATVGGISRKFINGVSIPFPELSEQKRIATILDNADLIRHKNQQILEKYDELAQSVFFEMFGDLLNNEKKFEETEFKKVFKSLRYGISTPPIYSVTGLPFIRATNVKKGGINRIGLVFVAEEDAKKLKKCILKEGDLIIVRSGVNTGDCARIPKEYNGSLGGFDIIIEIDEPYSTFYNFALNTKAGKAILSPLTRRAGQPHLNSKQISELQLLKPPIAQQCQFVEILNNIENQKELTQKNLEKCEELFQSLLQKAFNGEL